MQQDFEQKRRELEAECAKLRAENAELRAQLNQLQPITTKPDHAPQSETLITNESPAGEKIALFRRLFRGRDDVYSGRFNLMQYQ